jgi:hypothetical protein
MKARITMEIEISDLPEDVLEEMAEDSVGEGDDDEVMPGIDDCDPDDLASLVGNTLADSFDSYDTQAELWAGTGFFGYISKAKLIECVPIPEADDVEPQ